MPDFKSLADLSLEHRWRASEMPAPIVVAIIGRMVGDGDGKTMPHYLLIRRAGDPYRGRWALVGGKWDFGESLATAVVREVVEETGLQTTFVALRGIVSERLLPVEPARKDAAHFLLLVCQVDAGDGQASEQAEGAVSWFSAGQIEAMNQENQIIPSDYVMLQQFAGAPAIPHYEADVVSTATTAGAGSGEAQLHRFEEIF